MPLLVTRRVPVTRPVAVGVKVTEMVQLAPEPSSSVQLFVCAKLSLALTPTTPSCPCPVFVTVTNCAALVVPTPVAGKVSELFDRLTTGFSVPAPVKGTVCGLPVALPAIESVAERLPLAAGSKTSDTVHFAPAARDALQPFESLKSPRSCP